MDHLTVHESLWWSCIEIRYNNCNLEQIWLLLYVS